MKTSTPTPTKAIAYFDAQDPQNEGWAYRLYFEDGTDDSGPLSRSDENGEALDGLEAQVRVSGGDWDGGAVDWVAEEGGSYRWTA